MASPNVGQVVLGVAIDDKDLRSRLTESIYKEIKPALSEWEKQLDVISKDIDKINNQSFDRQARAAGLARKEFDKTSAAIKGVATQQRMLDKDEERLRKARERRNALQKKARAEEKENGKVSTATSKQLVTAVNAVTLAEADRAARKKALAEANKKVTQQEIDDEKRFTEAVEKATTNRIKARETEAREYRRLIDQTIADAEKRTQAEYDQGRKIVADRDKAYAEMAKLDQQRTRQEDAEIKKRERATKRAQRAEAAKRRQDNRQRQEEALFNQLANFGRRIGAVSQIGIAIAVPAAVFLILELVSVLATLSGALGTLPGLFLGAQAAMGTFQVATYGVDEALSALVSGDLEAFAEGLAKLAPNAQQAMLSLQSLWPEFTRIQQAVQDVFFEGFNERLYELANTFLPSVEQGMTALAETFNRFADVAVIELTTPETASTIYETINNIVEGFKSLEPAITPLIEAFATIAEVSTSFLPMLADEVVILADRFANFIEEAAATGQLQDWIEQGIIAVVRLIPLAEDLIAAFLAFAPLGEKILPDIVSWMDSMAKLAPIIVSGIEPLVSNPWAKALEFFVKMLENMDSAFRAIGNAGIWMYNKLTTVFNAIRPQLAAIYKPMEAMAKIFNSSPVARITGRQIDIPPLPEVFAPVEYMPLFDPPQTGVDGLVPWNQRFGAANGPFAPNGNYRFPGSLPVPPPPERNADGSKVTDSDRRKANEAELNPEDFYVDPWADIGGVNNQPGYPGRPPLNVEIGNLPMTPGLPGMTAIPGMASTPGMAAAPGMPSYVIDAMGAKPIIDIIAGIAKERFGLDVISGLAGPGTGREYDGGFHDSGNAGDFSDGVRTPAMRAFADYMISNYGQYLQQLIYQDSAGSYGIGGGQLTGPGTGQPGYYGTGTLAQHENHVHIAVKDEMAAALAQAIQSGGQAVPRSFKDNMYATNGPLVMDPGTGDMGYFQVDQQAVNDAAQAVERAAADLQNSSYEFALATKNFEDNLISQQDLLKAQTKRDEDIAKLEKEKADFRETQRGKFRDQKQTTMDYSKLPKGDPRRVMAGFLGGLGGDDEDIAMIIGGMGGSMGAGIGNPMGNVAGDIVRAVTSVPLPGPLGYSGMPTAPSTDAAVLAQQRNPLLLAQMAGIGVPDYTRQGGDPSSQNLNVNGGPPTDAMGRMYSDTAALIDRTFTNQNTEDKARHDQIMAVLNEVKARLGADLLAPVLEQGVAKAFESAGTGIGTAIGEAAGPIIGADVAAAIGGASTANTGGGASGSALVTTGANAIVAGVGAIGGFAAGGGVTGGVPGKDSVPALLMPNEYVLTADDVQRMGGFAGVDRFRTALARQGGVRKFATGGGVNADQTVGADFLGVSQIPIIGLIANLLVAVLLKVIDVQIESRDTLNEISSEFRAYRGDFQAFDAAGRLMNDTSGLVDRTGSSTQTAADERIRILKLVLEGLIKYIVEKIIVPIGKAVGNALVQAGAGAASGAISSLPGGSFASGAVQGVIESAGAAGIDIIAQVGTDFASAAANIGLEAAGQLIQGLLPGISNALFGGGLLAALFDPLSAALNGIIGGVTMLFGGLFGGLASVIPGLPFDEGGVATGTGLMPKATLAPERVLSPRQTMLFEKMVSALESGSRPSSSSTTTIHAPFTVTGSQQGGQQARDRLLALMS